MASFQERRQTIRIATNGQLNVECVGRGPALRLVDVGTGGFCALSLASMPIGAVANYRFTTPDGKWAAVFYAKTAYCRPEIRDGRTTGHFVVGFSFVTGQASVIQQIMAMIDVATGFVSYS